MWATQRQTFQKLQHWGISEGATLFPELLPFTLDTCFIMLSRQVSIFWVFGMTQPAIEPHLPDHWQTFYPLGQWTGQYICNSNKDYFISVTEHVCQSWRLVGWVLWHINVCQLFNAKSIFMQIVSSISTIQFSMSTQFVCQKHFYFKLFSLFKQF